MTPGNNYDYVGDNTWLTHFNLLFLVHKKICENNDNLIREGAVGVIHIDPTNINIDHNLRDIINLFCNQGDQNKISIAICRGSLQQNIGGYEEITGSSHWTGLHLRKITDDSGIISYKAYHMDSTSNDVPVPVKRILDSLGIPDVVGVKCNPQRDGHSCGYHTVCNLQQMHNLRTIADGFNSLQTVITEDDVNKFIAEEKAWLKGEFEKNFNTKLAETKLRDAENPNPKQKAEVGGKGQEEYREEFDKILSSDTYNNLDKIKKIIQIEDEVKQIKDDASKTLILNLLDFENYYKIFLSNFAGDLIFKGSSTKDPLFSDNEEVLTKRYKFCETVLYNKEKTTNPRGFLNILTAIDKYPELIDTINEIKADEDLKVKINESKKLFSGYIQKIEESEESEESDAIKKVTQFISEVDKVFDDNPTTSFKGRLDQLVVLSKLDSVPEELKNSFNFLSKVDDKNFLPAIIPDRYQLIPKEKFKGWGLKAVFKGMDLKIEGKEVIEILDERGNDILPELKKTFKDDPKLFAHAVTDFFRRAEGDIDLVYKDGTTEELNKDKKKSIKIVDGKVQSASEDMTETDNVNLFIDRMKSYSDNSATKASTKVILTESDKEVLEVFEQHINQRFELLGQLLENNPNKIAIIPGSKLGDKILCSFANGLAVNQWKDHCGGNKDRGDEMANQCRELFTQKSNELEKKYPKRVFFGNVGMKVSENFLPQFPVGNDRDTLLQNKDSGGEKDLVRKYESLCKHLKIEDKIKDEGKACDEKIIEYRKLLFKQDDAPLANKIFIHVWGANVGNFNNTTGNYQGGSSQAAAFKDQVEGVFGICSTPIGYDNTKKADLMADCKTHRALVAKSPSPSPRGPIVMSTRPGDQLLP